MCASPGKIETARIEGAKLIPMGDIPSRAHQELDPEDQVVVVCHHGVRSMNVTVWLRQQGFEKVAVHAWRHRRAGRGASTAKSRRTEPLRAPCASTARGNLIRLVYSADGV